MNLMDVINERAENPVDAIEQIAGMREWTFERSGEDEITISLGGSWCDYHISFAWMEDVEALHLACAFDLKVAARRRTEVVKLLALVNEQMWTGHFDLWSTHGVVVFRQTLLLSGGAEASAAQIESLLVTATESCEQYYQAFQFVARAGKSAPESLEAALFETEGEA